MFAYFYQFCAVVFFLQGISLPFLLIFAGVLWNRQNRRLEQLKKELEAERGKKTASDDAEAVLKKLPRLKPLNCRACGAGVALRETQTFCPHCRATGELPEDYWAAMRLKSEAAGLLKSAARYWRAARVLTYSPVGWLFFLLIFAEPLVIFPTVLIGSNIYPDTWLDRLFADFQEEAVLVLGLSAFLGFVIWMITFIFLSNLSKDLRKKLPVMPVFEKRLKGVETDVCRSCGGAVAYDSGSFVCLCCYCNTKNFRVRFARRERGKAEERKKQTDFAMFGAMSIIEEFVATFFFATGILTVAAFLLVIVLALGNSD